MNVLITGGFGFLGGRLGQHLSKDFNVFLGSRTSQKIPVWLSSAKVVEVNWDSDTSLSAACKSMDVIIHASGLNAQDCSNDPQKAFMVNGVYTKRLVEAAISQGVKKFIYLSTVHVYSDQLSGIISESSPTCNNHPYATSHVEGEKSVLSAASRGDIKGVVLRIANVFGCPAFKDVNCWTLLVNDLCKQAVLNRSIALRGDSTVVRDFISIDDFCLATSFLLKDKGATNSIVNIASGKVYTVGEMASMVQRHCFDIMGFEPILTLNQEGSSQKTLSFQTDYLDDRRFKFSNNFDDTIKELIAFCIKSFS